MLMSHCVADVHQCCQSRRLQLNSSKSEIIWLGTRHTLQKIPTSNLTLEIHVGDGVVQPVSAVCDLGVLVDQELTHKQHVAKIASSCFYQLRHLKQVRRYVDNDVMAQLVAAFVTSRLDYCNGVLAGLPQSTIAPIQWVQNVAAQLVRSVSELDRSQTVRPHNPNTSSTTLAAGRLSCAVQTVYINAHNH